MNKLRINPDSAIFSSCSNDRIQQIQRFLEVLVEHCGVRIMTETKQYCRLDRHPDNPRWIRLFPMSRRDAFVAAFYIERNKLSKFIRSAQTIGLYGEGGTQKKSQNTERFRLHISNDYDIGQQSFIDFLCEILDSYERLRD